MSRHFSFAGLPILGQTPAASTAATNMGESHLATQQLTDVWRSAGIYASRSTNWLMQVVGSSSWSVGCVAVLGVAVGGPTNFAYSYNSWRVRMDGPLAGAGGYPSLSLLIRPQIDSTQAITNLVDNRASFAATAYVLPAQWSTATNTSANTAARYRFKDGTATGSRPLKSGAGGQQFVALIRATGGGSLTITIDLYDNGVLKAAGTPQVLAPGTTPTIVKQTWDAAALASLTSTTVEAKISCTGAASGTTMEIGGLEWIADHTGYLYDSGNLTFHLPSTTNINLHLIHLPTNAVTVPANGSIHVEPDIDVRGPVTYSDAYIQAGRFYVSGLISPTVPPRLSSKMTPIPSSIVTTTIGGQDWSEIRPTWREAEYVFPYLLETEMQTLLGQLEMSKGITGDFLIIPQPDKPALYPEQALYCRLKVLSDYSPTTFLATGSDPAYQHAIQVKELL